ncbi:MAG: hypothetical protein JSR19_10710 [Proteobacteria bacterium]|nr:hypothetical protein [Pseudomonadota bacterium]HQR02890.1 hypothetical protein [Rhodocyclaceae bacterium]
MTDPDILGQADALMQRWRGAPTQTGAAGDDIPTLTDVVREGQPLPVLTEVVDPFASQRVALEAACEAWLDERLPMLVLRILDGLTDQLIHQLTQQARNELLPQLRRALEQQQP